MKACGKVFVREIVTLNKCLPFGELSRSTVLLVLMMSSTHDVYLQRHQAFLRTLFVSTSNVSAKGAYLEEPKKDYLRCRVHVVD